MLTVEILQGLPASGKSTYANNKVAKHPGRYIRVNRDSIRAMLHDSYYSKGNEKLTKQVRNQIILLGLENGKHIIVDDTNFGKNIDFIKELVKGKAKVIINDSFLEVSVEECIKRDLVRPNSVGQKVIMSFYNNFIATPQKLIQHNPALPDAIIVDVDGTLAITGDRSPFDMTKVDIDLPNTPVIDTVHLWQQQKKIIVFSGRDESALDATIQWLVLYGINFAEIHLRKVGDGRKDSIVKQEFFESFIKDKYNVHFVLDDRSSVVDMWRTLGLTVFQVAEGNF